MVATAAASAWVNGRPRAGRKTERSGSSGHEAKSPASSRPTEGSENEKATTDNFHDCDDRGGQRSARCGELVQIQEADGQPEMLGRGGHARRIP